MKMSEEQIQEKIGELYAEGRSSSDVAYYLVTWSSLSWKKAFKAIETYQDVADRKVIADMVQNGKSEEYILTYLKNQGWERPEAGAMLDSVQDKMVDNMFGADLSTH